MAKREAIAWDALNVADTAPGAGIHIPQRTARSQNTAPYSQGKRDLERKDVSTPTVKNREVARRLSRLYFSNAGFARVCSFSALRRSSDRTYA
jgi:hypothetical protein